MRIPARAPSLRLMSLLSLLALAVAAVPAFGAAEASHEELVVARTRMDAAAETVRKAHWRLGENDRIQRRELIDRAQKFHDDAKAANGTDRAAMGRLVTKLDDLRTQLEQFAAHADEVTAAAPAEPGGAASSGAEGEASSASDEAAEAAPEPAPEPEPDPTTMRPISVVTRYNDILQDALGVKGRLSAVENQRVADLRVEGNGLVHLIRQTAQRHHEERQTEVVRLWEIGSELKSLYRLGLTNRRKGIPVVQAGRTVVGWTVAGVGASPFTVLRTRFIMPGSAYVTVRSDSPEAHPFAISMEFTDITGESTGAAAWVSRPGEDLRPAEVREVLVAIAPSVPHFWEVTTDYTVDVQ